MDRSAFENVMNGLPWPESGRAVFPGISDEDLATARAFKKLCFDKEVESHPCEVDKTACSLVCAFKIADCQIWLVTAGSRDPTFLKLRMLPEDVQEAFGQILTRIDKTGDTFYGRLRRRSDVHWPIVLVDDDPRVWKAAREKLDGIAVVEWGR